MSPLVERVSNTFPHVQRTVATAYSGWISVFMMSPIVDGFVARARGWRSASAGAREAELVRLVALVDDVARVSRHRQRVARPARRAADEDLVAVAVGDRRRFGAQHGAP